MRRALQRREDPRLSSSLHRPGGGRRRCDGGPRTGGRHRLDLPRARSCARPRRLRALDPGRDVRSRGGLQSRAGRLHASLRRRASLLRRTCDRGRWTADGGRARARGPPAEARAGLGLLLRRGRRRRGRVPRVAEPGRALAPAGALLLREQSLRDGDRDRALRVRDRARAEGGELLDPGLVGRRHGRRGGGGRRAPRGTGDPRRERTDLPGAPDLPVSGPFHVRSRAIPREGRGGELEGARSDLAPRAADARGGQPRRCPARGARGRRRRRDRGRRRLRRRREPRARRRAASLRPFRAETGPRTGAA